MEEKKKKIIIASSVALVLLLTIGGTFAYFMAQGNGSASRNVNVTTHTTDSLMFEIDKSISITADQENFAQGKGNRADSSIATATLKANNATNSAAATYNVFFIIDDNDFEYTTAEKTAELILSVKKNGTPVTAIEGLTPVTVNGVSGFDITERKDSIEVAKDEAITTTSEETDSWEVTVTLVNLDSDQNNNTGKTLNGRVYISKDYSLLKVANAITEKTDNSITVNLNMLDSTTEIDKYYFAIEEKSNAVAMANSKAKVVRLSNTNLTYHESDTPSYTFTGLTEGATYMVYGYAQDKQGIKSNQYKKEIILIETLAEHIVSLYTTQGSNNLYHHDGTLENGINDGSYRYSGKYESVNNWVCFGSNEETCHEDNLYRIIGVFDEKIINEDGTDSGLKEKRVKLIMNNYAGESVLGKSQDGTSSLYSLFTGSSKPNEDQPAYYWIGSLSTYSNNWLESTLNTETLNGTYLNILGSEWINKIAINEWNIGGNSSTNIMDVKVAMAYQNEIVNPAKPTTEAAKVGLMYANDYGFAASPVNWQTSLNNYNNDINPNNTSLNNNWLYRGVHEWTISPCVDSRSENAFLVYFGGGVSYNLAFAPHSTSGVRPTFYLNSSVIFAGGEGTESNPFRIN